MATTPPSLDAIVIEIDQWFDENIRNSVIAREVAAYNHMHAAWHDLKERVAALFTGKSPAVAVPGAESVAAVSQVEAQPLAADQDSSSPKPKPAT